jgi:hypothetical protein
MIPAWVNFCPQLRNRFSVHRDAPGQNNLFTGPTRCDAGIGQEFLQPNHGEMTKAE